MRFIGIKLKVRRTLVEEIEASIIRYAPDTEEIESEPESDKEDENAARRKIRDVKSVHDEDDVACKGASGSEMATENDGDGNGGGYHGGEAPREELNPNGGLEDQDDERERDYSDKMYLFSPCTQDYRIKKVSHASLASSPYSIATVSAIVVM